MQATTASRCERRNTHFLATITVREKVEELSTQDSVALKPGAAKFCRNAVDAKAVNSLTVQHSKEAIFEVQAVNHYGTRAKIDGSWISTECLVKIGTRKVWIKRKTKYSQI